MKCLWFSFPRFCDSLKRGCVQRREKPNDILGSLICFKWWVFQKPVLPEVIWVPRGMRSSAERREL